MQVYRVAAIRLMWTYNELMKCKTKITYKITLWYLNIQFRVDNNALAILTR